jgi:hypothetical protein
MRRGFLLSRKIYRYVINQFCMPTWEIYYNLSERSTYLTNSKNKSHYNVDFGRMELEYIKSLLNKERKDLEKEKVNRWNK